MRTREALQRSQNYPHAVMSYVGADGYPVSLATNFKSDVERSSIEVGPMSEDMLPSDGQQMNLTFSHIRPVEEVGYDERRYINVHGQAAVNGDHVVVKAETATGWDEKEIPFFEYCERNVGRGLAYLEDVGSKPRLAAGWLFFIATRLPFLTATIIPILLGATVAASHGFFSWGLLGLTLLGGASLHLGLNVANDVFDDMSGADSANVTPTPFSGGSRVIQYGLLTRRAMAMMSVLFYAVGIGVGIYLAETRGTELYILGIAGILVSIAYTAPPFRLVNRGLGEGAVALGFGPITTLGAYFVMARDFSGEALYASLPVAIFIALVLYLNEVPDRPADSAVGKRTLVVRWSKGAVVRGFFLAAATAYLLVVVGVALRILPVYTLGMLATIPMARSVVRDLRQNFDKPYELMPAMQRNTGLHLVAGLLLIVGYVVETHIW